MTKTGKLTPDELGKGGRGYPFTKKSGAAIFSRAMVRPPGGSGLVKGGPPPFVCVKEGVAPALLNMNAGLSNAGELQTWVRTPRPKDSSRGMAGE